MKLFEITEALLDEIKENFVTDHKIKYPIGLPFDSGGKPYYEPIIKPNFTEKVIGRGFKNHGIITVNFWYNSEKGDYYGMKEAQKIADFFTEGKEINGVFVSERPEVKGHIDNGNKWWFNPVSIEYYNKECLDNG